MQGFPQKLYVQVYETNVFVLVALDDRGLFQCVNVTDPTRPNIFGGYFLSGELGYDLTFPEDRKHIFIIGTNGIRVLPLDVPINVHTQFARQSIANGITAYEFIDRSIFFVGDLIYSFFVPVGVT